jgi:hypothetical protein
MCEAASESSGDSGRDDDESAQGSSHVVVRVCMSIFPVSICNIDITLTYVTDFAYSVLTLIF